MLLPAVLIGDKSEIVKVDAVAIANNAKNHIGITVHEISSLLNTEIGALTDQDRDSEYNIAPSMYIKKTANAEYQIAKECVNNNKLCAGESV